MVLKTNACLKTPICTIWPAFTVCSMLEKHPKDHFDWYYPLKVNWREVQCVFFVGVIQNTVLFFKRSPLWIAVSSSLQAVSNTYPFPNKAVPT